jgi:hypothetical protein
MTDEVARFVWKLSRRHSWGSPIPEEALIRLTVRDEDYDEMRRVLEDRVLELPFVVRDPSGVYIPNGRDAHVAAADWLSENTEISDVKIEATLSRLPDDWPSRH